MVRAAAAVELSVSRSVVEKVPNSAAEIALICTAVRFPKLGARPEIVWSVNSRLVMLLSTSVPP